MTLDTTLNTLGFCFLTSSMEACGGPPSSHSLMLSLATKPVFTTVSEKLPKLFEVSLPIRKKIKLGEAILSSEK